MMNSIILGLMLFLSGAANAAPPLGPFRRALHRALTAGHVFDRSVSASTLGGLLHAEASGKGRISAFGASAAINKRFHVGPFGVDANFEAELSIFRLALDLSMTPTFGHRDYYIEYGGIDHTDLQIFDRGFIPGFDVGYNRWTRTYGGTVDLRRGSFGAHFGCMTTVCAWNCVTIKLVKWC